MTLVSEIYRSEDPHDPGEVYASAPVSAGSYTDTGITKGITFIILSNLQIFSDLSLYPVRIFPRFIVRPDPVLIDAQFFPA